MGYIYRIRNRITGKSYIGETIKEPEARWKQHIACANAGKGCPALRDAFKKHGIKSFEFKVIIICFDEDRFFYERDYIKRYNTQAPNGYNILPGGIGGPGFKGKVHTEDVRKVIGEKSKAMWKGFDEAQREKMKQKGREQLKKNVESFKQSGKWNEIIEKSRKRMKELRTGTKHPEETKNKIRDAVNKYYSQKTGKNKINIEKHRDVMCKAVGRPIGQYTCDGVLVKEHKSISEASRTSGIGKSNIQQMLRGNTKHAGGFIWKYLDTKA